MRNREYQEDIENIFRKFGHSNFKWKANSFLIAENYGSNYRSILNISTMKIYPTGSLVAASRTIEFNNFRDMYDYIEDKLEQAHRMEDDWDDVRVFNTQSIVDWNEDNRINIAAGSAGLLQAVSSDGCSMEYVGNEIKNRGEDNMKVIDLYEEKRIKELQEKRQEGINAIYNNSEFTKVKKVMAESIANIVEDEFELKNTIDHAIGTLFKKHIEVELEKLDDEYSKEVSKVKESVEEIKAMASMEHMTYEDTMKVLETYGVVTKKGVLK